MVKSLLLPLAGVAAFIVVVGLLVNSSGNVTFPGVTPEVSSLARSAVTLGGKTVNVEVANTEATRELGLGGRTSLSKDSGMLFVFDSKGISPGFWMKGMLIPLDIVWIRGGKVVAIDKNIQPPAAGISDENLIIYNPGVPIDYVLEVNAGYSDSNGVKVGSSVDLSKI